MPIKFTPRFQITPKIAGFLMRIEAAKEKVLHCPLTPTVLVSIRESAKLFTTHYSTMIEGNRLTVEQIDEVLKKNQHFPGRERDEKEVKGYYAALDQIEQWVASANPVNEKRVQFIHALVMGGGRKTAKPTPYRDGQNAIRDSGTRAIVYMPPTAQDVPDLMQGLIRWVHENPLPCPIIAAIAHYQFATIHPYYDGNGRTARLLTTYLLHLGGYGLKGLYSLEEYYAKNLGGYYDALTIGPSHNYYSGRAEADITSWIEYFIDGMTTSFEKVLQHMADAKGEPDNEAIIRKLDPKQRKVLELFQSFEIVTSHQIGALFGFKPRTCSELCKKWTQEDFLEAVDLSKKGRKYRLANQYKILLL